jgi:hypothetical protein
MAFMNSTIQRVLFAVAVAALGAGAVGTACAQTNSSAPSTTPPHHMHRGHFRGFGGAPFVGMLLRATKQLGVSQPQLALTQTQQDSIKSIIASARHGHRPGTQAAGITVLGDPGNQGYAAAVQAAETAAQSRIQQQSLLEQDIYGVLSKAQKDQLPIVLASIQAKEQARRAQWASRHATGNG